MRLARLVCRLRPRLCFAPPVQGHNAHTKLARNFALQFPLTRQITCLRQFRRDFYPGVPFVLRHSRQLRGLGQYVIVSPKVGTSHKSGHFASDNRLQTLSLFKKFPVICWRNLDFRSCVNKKNAENRHFFCCTTTRGRLRANATQGRVRGVRLMSGRSGHKVARASQCVNSPFTSHNCTVVRANR